MTKYMCIRCACIYDEIKGDVESSILPGTPFSSLPDDWKCPDCGAVIKVFRRPSVYDREEQENKEAGW